MQRVLPVHWAQALLAPKAQQQILGLRGMTALQALPATKERKATQEKLGHRVTQVPQGREVFLGLQQILVRLVLQV